MKAAKSRIRSGYDISADDISGISPSSPEGLGGGYEFLVPLLDGDHVTDDTGTGFVHTAPGHGTDDFEIWMTIRPQLTERGIDTSIPFTVDDDGFLTDQAPA